ncbi:MAG: hypothetical protein HY287_01320 [Planctomycetes bacterium]|nr:hypothetical protein [Planctomycetota bacterium]
MADYPACVQGLIQQEAERRGVTADTAVNEGELPTKLLIRKIADLAELPWRLRPLVALLAGCGIPSAFSLLPLYESQ